MDKHHNRQGFTLIRLVMATAILTVLLGLIVLTLNSNSVKAEGAAADEEFEVVQLALDRCAVTNSCSISASGPAQVGPGTGGPNGFGVYLDRPSRFLYAWDAEGIVIQQQNTSGDVLYP